MKILIGGIIVVLVVGGTYFFLLRRPETPVPAPSPTPTASAPPAAPASPTPSVAPPPPAAEPAPAAPPAAEVRQVTIQNFSFQPNEIRIKAGTKVVWTNQDSAGHTVTSDTAGVFGSSLLRQSDSFEHVFAAPGTFTYHCNPHPFMKAKVIVE